MNAAEAKEYGTNRGHRAAGVVIAELNRDDYASDDAYTDAVTTEAYESELHSRQYSPFEMTASAINALGDDAEEAWEAYDDGLERGIKRAIRIWKEDRATNPS
jgi:hypothetical protein